VLSFIVRWLLTIPSIPALILVFMLPALEASVFLGFIFPGETAVVVGGVLASFGRFPLWLTVVAASLGAVGGDTAGYFIGKKFGPWLLDKLPARLVKPETVDKAVSFIARRGGLGVVVGRFTTALRVVVPGAAGIAEMRYQKFLLFNALGGIAWASLYSVLGYEAGKNYERVLKQASTTSVIVFVAVALALVLFAAFRHVRSLIADK
jgi:membrane-associated protein